MVSGEYFVLYHLRVPLVTMSQERTQLILSPHLVPIDIGVPTKNAHLAAGGRVAEMTAAASAESAAESLPTR